MLGNTILKDSLQFKYHNYMAAFILQEKQKPRDEQKFGPYMDILPDSFDDFPLSPNNMKDDGLSLLNNTQLLLALKSRQQIYQQDYDKICEEVPQFARYSLNQYQEAMLISQSRCFTVNVDGVQQEFLAPLVDMCNHTYPDVAKFYFDNAKKQFVVQAITDIEIGKEVCTTYTSDQLNQKLFLSYGFLSDTGYYNVFVTLQLT